MLHAMSATETHTSDRDGSRPVPLRRHTQQPQSRRDGYRDARWTVLPAIPFIFGTSVGCVLASVAITLLAAAVIGHYCGYLVAYAIRIAISVLTVGLSIAVA